MHWRPLIALLACICALDSAISVKAQNPTLVERICVYDGLKHNSLLSAMNECGERGLPVIPPTFSGQEPANAKNPVVWDFRQPEVLKRLTPVTEFGAKGDAEMRSDGASVSGTTTFTATSSLFVRGRDEGKAIIITGAGPENASLTTTIKAIDSPNRITLEAPAAFTASGLTYWYGTDNTLAMQTAYGSRKPLFLPPGKFLMTGTVKGSDPLLLAGAGPQSVIINDTTVFSVHGTNGHFLDNFRMQAATKLAPILPRSFPTPHAGTPITVDRIGTGIGYQPEMGDDDIWSKVSKQQQEQQIGPTLTMSSDGIHIYRITGDLVSIVLFDTQFSEVVRCDFRGGKNFVGGIALWHSPGSGAVNRRNSIRDNTIRYASFSGIAWATAEDILIKNNVVEYNGESGLKNFSSFKDGTYNKRVEVVGNQSRRNHYDGLDMSQSFPHSNSQVADSIVSGNLSSSNFRTGLYVDGIGWKLIDNTIEINGLTGLSADVSNSVISGNVLTHNNTLHDQAHHQMLIGPARPSLNNIFERNRIEADGASGAAIKLSPLSTGNQLRDNVATGGTLFQIEAKPAESHGNSDSRGRYPDR